MGQVPQYALIGDGRVARHLSDYFRSLQISFQLWSRRTGDTAAFNEVIDRSPIILLAITDSAIEPFIAEHPELEGKTLIHFSGALDTSKAHGFHPLMTFGPELYSADVYRAMPFVFDQDAPSFEEIFPQLPNPSYRIPKDAKALYHALCVLSGNFTVVLWQKLFSDLESRFGIPSSVAVPYLNQVAANLAQDWKAALTGPLQRRDFATIRANWAALEGDPFQEIYAAFARVLAEGGLS